MTELQKALVSVTQIFLVNKRPITCTAIAEAVGMAARKLFSHSTREDQRVAVVVICQRLGIAYLPEKRR